MADLTILWRSEPGKEWKEVKTTKYADETKLQDLLYSSPSIVPVQELSSDELAFTVAIKEAGLSGAGSSDLILINPQGTIGIVECKLATNSDIRRKVVGQVLEYAAALWQMSYNDLNEICQTRENKSLDELMAEKVSHDKWDEESFRQAVEDNLSQGRFLLTIAVDAVNSELERIIEYMNRAGVSGIQIAALELRLMKQEGAEILVPRLIGPMPPVPTSPPSQWTEKDFLDACEKTEGVIGQLMKNTYEFAKSKVDVIKWGRAQVPGYVALIKCRGKGPYTLFYATAHGWVKINKVIIQQQVDKELCDWFVGELKKVEGFANMNWELKFVSGELQSMTERPKETMDAFCQLLSELVDKIRALPNDGKKD